MNSLSIQLEQQEKTKRQIQKKVVNKLKKSTNNNIILTN